MSAPQLQQPNEELYFDSRPASRLPNAPDVPQRSQLNSEGFVPAALNSSPRSPEKMPDAAQDYHDYSRYSSALDLSPEMTDMSQYGSASGSPNGSPAVSPRHNEYIYSANPSPTHSYSSATALASGAKPPQSAAQQQRLAASGSNGSLQMIRSVGSSVQLYDCESEEVGGAYVDAVDGEPLYGIHQYASGQDLGEHDLADHDFDGLQRAESEGTEDGESGMPKLHLSEAPYLGPEAATPPHRSINAVQHEIRREAQQVEPMRIVSNHQHTPHMSQPESVLSQNEWPRGQSRSSSRSPPLLDSLPTPRTWSPRLSGVPLAAPVPQHPRAPAPTGAYGSGPLGAALAASSSGGSGFSHSPQASQSSASDGSMRSVDTVESPRLTNSFRPRSTAPSRNSQRLSYYDFGAKLNIPTPTEMGPGSNALMPRMKTIELYKKSARKTNDPELEFQLAQYMIQTALMSDPAPSDGSTSSKGHSPASSRASAIGESMSSASLHSTDTADTTSANKERSMRHSLMKEALGSLKRLSERGYPDAQYLLGDIYASGAIGGKPDMEKSLRYFLMAAKHGHAESAYRAALCLQEGWGTSRDANRALQFYKRAAVRNQPGALYQLGMAYFYAGMGLPDNSANRQAGVKWLTRAVNVANRTFNRAPHELAKIHEVGYKDLVLPDDVYAVKLYARSAELGYVPSAARLGRAYEFGELGCPQDPSLSIHYYTIAALGNDPNAQLSMCAWYMVGAGPSFPVNQDEAYEWALRAALNGLPKAQYTLGFFLENGVGAKRDILAAGKWYRRAAAGGYEKAAVKLSGLGIVDEEKKKGKCLVM